IRDDLVTGVQTCALPIYLALTNMGLGDKAAALALSERAMAVLPIEKDALYGSMPIEILARVEAGTGDPEHAIATLKKLLSMPYRSEERRVGNEGVAVGAV